MKYTHNMSPTNHNQIFGTQPLTKRRQMAGDMIEVDTL
jgi:hypothetical protein